MDAASNLVNAEAGRPIGLGGGSTPKMTVRELVADQGYVLTFVAMWWGNMWVMLAALFIWLTLTYADPKQRGRGRVISTVALYTASAVAFVMGNLHGH